MILAHLPGFSLLARGGNLSNMSLVNALARVAGFTSTKARPSLRAPLVGTETCAKQPGHSPLAPSDDRDGERQVEQFIASLPASPATKAPDPVQEVRPGREFTPASSRLKSLISPEPRAGRRPQPHRPAADTLNGLSSESTAFPSPRGAGSSASDATGDAGQSDEQGFMGLTSLLMRWPGDGIAKFQFVSRPPFLTPPSLSPCLPPSLSFPCALSLSLLYAGLPSWNLLHFPMYIKM